MAQPQQNVTISAPGFAGLNTQDSPLDMDKSFASVANNCVIDRYGRIASRKGFNTLTTNPEILNGPVTQMYEFVADDGVSYLFACTDDGIYIQNLGSPDYDVVLLTAPDIITAGNWQIVQLNNKCFFAQVGHGPLVFDPTVSTTALTAWAQTPASGSPNVIHAAFGRLWAADFAGAHTIIYWSSLLDGESWTDGGTGSLNTEEYWPSGWDDIKAVAAHNNFLVIFGETQILLYHTTPDVNNSINLVDTISGIGCIARDTIVATGKDVMFLDATGVRSLNRTIQEKSVPIGDISRNVRNEFQKAISEEGALNNVRAVFHVEDSFYACFLPSNPKTYIFDTWAPLQQGEARCTVWTNVIIRCGVRTIERATYFGGSGGVYEYTGASDFLIDVDNAYELVTRNIFMEYYTHPMAFGDAATLLFPKQVDVTLIGGLSGKLALNWAFDYKDPSNRIEQDIGADAFPAYWGGPAGPNDLGIEWGVDGKFGYWTGGLSVQQLKYNIWGSGRNLKVGFTTDTAGSTVSIQELNVQVLQGRIL